MISVKRVSQDLNADQAQCWNWGYIFPVTPRNSGHSLEDYVVQCLQEADSHVGDYFPVSGHRMEVCWRGQYEFLLNLQYILHVIITSFHGTIYDAYFEQLDIWTWRN